MAEFQASHFYAIKNLCTSTHLRLVLLPYNLRLAERLSHFLRDPLQMAQLLVFFCYDLQVLLLYAAVLLLPGSFLLSAQYNTKEVTRKLPVPLMISSSA